MKRCSTSSKWYLCYSSLALNEILRTDGRTKVGFPSGTNLNASSCRKNQRKEFLWSRPEPLGALDKIRTVSPPAGAGWPVDSAAGAAPCRLQRFSVHSFDFVSIRFRFYFLPSSHRSLFHWQFSFFRAISGVHYTSSRVWTTFRQL